MMDRCNKTKGNTIVHTQFTLNNIDPETMMDRRNKTDTTHAIHIEHWNPR